MSKKFKPMYCVRRINADESEGLYAIVYIDKRDIPILGVCLADKFNEALEIIFKSESVDYRKPIFALGSVPAVEKCLRFCESPVFVDDLYEYLSRIDDHHDGELKLLWA